MQTVADHDEPHHDPPQGMAALALAVQPLTQTLAAPLRLATTYRAGYLRGDILSAVTVALVAVPQSMAFAEIAGLGPAVGLYTMIVGAVVGGLFTSSKHLSIGPTNTVGILTLAVVMLAPSGASPEEKITFAAAAALLAGLMQIAFALLRMGELVRYVSQSVIVGFSAGAGVLIAVKQVPAFLGVSVSDIDSPWHGVAHTVHQLLQSTDRPDVPAILVGTASLAIALLCRRISKWLPAYMIAIIAGALIARAMNWTHGELRLVGTLPTDLPRPSLPGFDLDVLRLALLPAAAIALMGMLESYSIGKTAAHRAGDRIDANQQFIAQGLTNVAASLFRCMPCSGSFSRTALSSDAGSRTGFSCVLTGLLVAIIFLIFAPAAHYIPMASIAAILFPIAYSLIDWRYVRRLVRSNHADFAVCIGTFIASLTIALELAVFVGVFLNIALYLRRAREVFVMEMLRDEGSPTGLIERPLRRGAAAEPDERGIVFLQLEGNLFFAAADELEDRFAQVMQRNAKAVILRLKRTHLVDASIMYTLEQFARQMQARGGHVLLCGVRPRMKQRMAEFGLIDVLGADHVFTTGNDLFGSAKAAITKARVLTGAELGRDRAAMSTPGEPAANPSPWTYEI